MENLEKKLEIFLQKLKKLNTKSLPGARNWYTHWSDDPPQSEGSNFRIFDYLVFFAHLRGLGGYQVQKIFFLRFVICCSPGYPRSKMGSFASQLQTVAEIWLDEDDAFSHVFGLLYRKMG